MSCREMSKSLLVSCLSAVWYSLLFSTPARKTLHESLQIQCQKFRVIWQFSYVLETQALFMRDQFRADPVETSDEKGFSFRQELISVPAIGSWKGLIFRPPNWPGRSSFKAVPVLSPARACFSFAQNHESVLWPRPI